MPPKHFYLHDCFVWVAPAAGVGAPAAVTPHRSGAVEVGRASILAGMTSPLRTPARRVAAAEPTDETSCAVEVKAYIEKMCLSKPGAISLRCAGHQAICTIRVCVISNGMHPFVCLDQCSNRPGCYC